MHTCTHVSTSAHIQYTVVDYTVVDYGVVGDAVEAHSCVDTDSDRLVCS